MGTFVRNGDSSPSWAIRSGRRPLAERIHDELGVPRGPLRVAFSPEFLPLVLTVRFLRLAQEAGELFLRQVRGGRHVAESTEGILEAA